MSESTVDENECTRTHMFAHRPIRRPRAHQPRIRQPRRRHAQVDGVYPDLVLRGAHNQQSADDRNPRNTKRNQPATHQKAHRPHAVRERLNARACRLVARRAPEVPAQLRPVRVRDLSRETKQRNAK